MSAQRPVGLIVLIACRYKACAGTADKCSSEETSEDSRIARTRFRGDSVGARDDRDRTGTMTYYVAASRGTGTGSATFDDREPPGRSHHAPGQASVELYATCSW
jgi:hypothetical protein